LRVIFTIKFGFLTAARVILLRTPQLALVLALVLAYQQRQVWHPVVHQPLLH